MWSGFNHREGVDEILALNDFYTRESRWWWAPHLWNDEKRVNIWYLLNLKSSIWCIFPLKFKMLVFFITLNGIYHYFFHEQLSVANCFQSRLYNDCNQQAGFQCCFSAQACSKKWCTSTAVSHCLTAGWIRAANT